MVFPRENYCAERNSVNIMDILVVDGTAPIGRPKNICQNIVSSPVCLLGVDLRDVQDHVKWMAIRKREANTAVSGVSYGFVHGLVTLVHHFNYRTWPTRKLFVDKLLL